MAMAGVLSAWDGAFRGFWCGFEGGAMRLRFPPSSASIQAIGSSAMPMDHHRAGLCRDGEASIPKHARPGRPRGGATKHSSYMTRWAWNLRSRPPALLRSKAPGMGRVRGLSASWRSGALMMRAGLVGLIAWAVRPDMFAAMADMYARLPAAPRAGCGNGAVASAPGPLLTFEMSA